MTLLVLVLVWALCELGWWAVPALRSQRVLCRGQLLFFVAIVFVLYEGTAFHVIPDRFHYGNGVLRYASDSLTYQAQAAQIADGLRRGSLAALADDQKSGYSKLLGIVYAVTGDNGLTAMLLNGIFYSATLACIFLIGRELFDDATGRWAMVFAGAWPGFFLHETQTIRWVETTLGVELTILGAVMVIRRGWTPYGVGATLVGFAVLMTDLPYMAQIVGALTTVFGVGLMATSLWRREFPRQALAVVSLGVVMIAAYHYVWSASFDRGTALAVQRQQDLSGPKEAPGESDDRAEKALRGLRAIIDARTDVLIQTREGYRLANKEGRVGTAIAGSKLSGVLDLIETVPTALAAAIFAPSPRMALSNEQGTSNFRKFVLIELPFYVALLGLAALGLLSALRGRWGAVTRRQVTYVALVTLSLYVLFGTVILNGGTLYRFRQPYVLLQIVLAVAGGTRVSAYLRARRSSKTVAHAV